MTVAALVLAWGSRGSWTACADRRWARCARFGRPWPGRSWTCCNDWLTPGTACPSGSTGTRDAAAQQAQRHPQADMNGDRVLTPQCITEGPLAEAG
jgi:hypothetical protein